MGFWPVVRRVLEECDIIVVVRDARVPDLSKNEEIDQAVRKSRKLVFEVFNKIDLIPKAELEALKKENPDAIFTISTEKKGTDILKRKLVEKAQLVKSELRVGILGYPNMGKSALINALAGRNSAKVSSVAGTTKGSQWIKISDKVLLIDTPGVVPFTKDDDDLVLLSAKNPEKLKDVEKSSYVIVKYLTRHRPETFKKYAKSNDVPRDVQEALELIGKNRNYLLKGNVVDINRTSIQIIRDWQNGKIK